MLNTKTWRWEHPPASESTPAGRQRHTAALVRGRQLVVVGGFDGFRWLSDVSVLDLGKWEDSTLAMGGVLSLLSDLGGLVNNPAAFPDVTFLLERGAHRVVGHRAILSARCAYFRAMFGAGMREASQPVVELREELITRDAFLALLWWAYTGSVPDLAPETALDALGVAQYFAADGLKSQCESVLLPLVDAGNATALLLAAHRHGAGDLKRFCMEFVFKHAGAVREGARRQLEGGWGGGEGGAPIIRLPLPHLPLPAPLPPPRPLTPPPIPQVDISPLSSEPQLLLEITQESMARARRAGGS